MDSRSNIYVTDAGTDSVVELRTDGERAVVPFAGLSRPSGVKVTEDGTVYVVDQGNDRVVALDRSGTQIVLPFTFEDFARPWGIVVADDGTVLVTVRHYGNEPIKKLGADGRETTLEFDATGSPTDIDIDADGNVYIVNFGGDRHIVDVACLDRAGHTSRVSMRANVLRPIGIALDPCGDLIVVDSVGSVFRLRRGTRSQHSDRAGRKPTRRLVDSRESQFPPHRRSSAETSTALPAAFARPAASRPNTSRCRMCRHARQRPGSAGRHPVEHPVGSAPDKGEVSVRSQQRIERMSLCRPGYLRSCHPPHPPVRVVDTPPSSAPRIPAGCGLPGRSPQARYRPETAAATVLLIPPGP